MNKLSKEEERDAVDFITDCMYSIDYLLNISNLTFSDKKDSLTLGGFYEAWFKKISSPRKAIIPFNPGIFLAYLYVGILYAKENWFNLLPNDEIEKSDEMWGLKGTKVLSPKKSNPTVQYAVRRIRNSLGHGSPVITVPKIKPEELFTKITFSFHDRDIRDEADIFDITLTLEQLNKLIKKFQSTIHKFVREQA